MIVVVEALFTLVFIWSVTLYVRDRDPLQRDVALVFACVGLLSLLDVLQRIAGPPPLWVNQFVIAALLAQPYLMLRLVSRLRAVPAWLMWSALVVIVVSATPLVVAGGSAKTVFVLLGVGAFVIVDLTAAGFLAAEARKRAGSPRVRLAIASAATVLFGLALFVAGAGRGSSNPAAFVTTSRIFALAASIGYVAAFLPPAWLRRRWSAGAAYAVSKHLMSAPMTEGEQETWRRFSSLIRNTVGADGAVILTAKGEEIAEATSGVPKGPPAGVTSEDLRRFVDVAGPADRAGRGGRKLIELAKAYAERIGAKFSTAVPLRMPSGGTGVLILLNRYRSLFGEDDLRLLAELGAQAAVLAERASVLAEQQRLTAELTESVAALTAASKAKGDFFASVSHELRTPLNAIIGFSDLMRAEDVVDGQRVIPAEWVEHIFSSGHRLLRLVDDILDMAKVEAGQMPLRREPVALPEAVADAVATLRPLLDAKGIAVRVSVPPLTVSVDAGRFHQVLDNLLSNAIKFTPHGGAIRIKAARHDAEVQISVIDNGIGIAQADHERVFEEFQQVGDGASQLAGTGLGLALTRRLVQAHGGRITLRSELGQGAEFTVCLPDVYGAIDLDLDGPRLIDTTGRPGSRGILLIEDEPSAVRLLRTYLEEAGYQVLVATSGEAGLEVARRAAPDSILLDILLPGMDGWEVLRQLKSDPAVRDIPVIIVTVLDEKDVALALGAIDYFVKPIEKDQLLSRLDHLAKLAVLPPRNATTSVLAIDDDQMTLDLIEASLTREGYRVATASSGADGLRLAQLQQFDLIICDLLMPDVDGFAVIAALAADASNRQVPILVLTGKDLTDADKARLNGKIASIMHKGEAGKAGLLERLAWLPGLRTRRATAEPQESRRSP